MMQKYLFTIGYAIDIPDIQKQIEMNHFRILSLESSKFEYNVKTFRIAHEIIKKGFKPEEIKFINKKEEHERNLLNITLINSI